MSFSDRNSEAGAQFVRYRRSMLRQQFYGLVTNLVKEIIGRDPSAESKELLFQLCRIDSGIEIAEQLQRMNDLTLQAQRNGDMLAPGKADEMGMVMRRMMEVATGKVDPMEHLVFEKQEPSPTTMPYVCRRCGREGGIEAIAAGVNSFPLMVSKALVHHAKVNPRCAADPGDPVFRLAGVTDEEWGVMLKIAAETSAKVLKQFPQNGTTSGGNGRE
ncbi:MAG TPA: hypothetical protein VJN64_15120 [Terriglobales bacterium]|nr:hypothetical protein [Terriglobales bacterium]